MELNTNTSPNWIGLTTSSQLALLQVHCGHSMAKDERDMVCSWHVVNGKQLLNLFLVPLSLRSNLTQDSMLGMMSCPFRMALWEPTHFLRAPD